MEFFPVVLFLISSHFPREISSPGRHNNLGNCFYCLHTTGNCKQSNTFSPSLPFFLFLSLSQSLPLFLSIYLSIHISIYISIYLSVCLSIYLSTTNLSIYLSIYLCLSLYMFLCFFLYFNARNTFPSRHPHQDC